MLITRCRRNFILPHLARLCYFYKYGTLNLKVKLCEVPDVCKSEEWNSVIQESRAALQNGAANRPNHRICEKSIPTTQVIIRRLQESSQNNDHLIEIFKQLLANTEANTTELRWPGLITLMLSKGLGSPFQTDDFISKALEDVIWSSQVTLAEVINLLYCKLLFQKENRRLASSRTCRIGGTEIDRLVDSYFTSSVLQKIFNLKNDKVLFLVAKVLESFSNTKYSVNVGSHPVQNLQTWEHATFHPQALLLAAGCQSTLELSGFDERSQQMAFEFGEYFTFAIKANGDIQQFWNYQRSHSSVINTSSFPIALHLEKHPETLAYIYSCSETLDNLDYNILNTMLMTNAAMDDARHQLSLYVQKSINILQEFQHFKNSEIIELLLKLIKTLENIDKN